MSYVATYVLEQDLEDLLRAIFGVEYGRGHEVLEALAYANITTWRHFTSLLAEDVDRLSIHTPARSHMFTRSRIRASLATRYKEGLMLFLGMINRRMEYMIPGAYDI